MRARKCSGIYILATSAHTVVSSYVSDLSSHISALGISDSRQFQGKLAARYGQILAESSQGKSRFRVAAADLAASKCYGFPKALYVVYVVDEALH